MTAHAAARQPAPLRAPDTRLDVCVNDARQAAMPSDADFGPGAPVLDGLEPLHAEILGALSRLDPAAWASSTSSQPAGDSPAQGVEAMPDLCEPAQQQVSTHMPVERLPAGAGPDGAGLSLPAVLRLCLLGAAGVTAGPAKDLNLMQQGLGILRSAGMNSLQVAVVHNQPGQDDLLWRLMSGLTSGTSQDASPPSAHIPSQATTLHIEANYPSGDPFLASLEQAMNTPGGRGWATDVLLNTHRDPARTAQGEQRLRQVMLNPSLTMRLMNWLSVDRADMSRVLGDADFTLAFAGVTHFQAHLVEGRPDFTRTKWVGNFTAGGLHVPPVPLNRKLPRGLQQADLSANPALSLAAQRDFVNGFERSRAIDGEGDYTVQMVTDVMWSMRAREAEQAFGAAGAPRSRDERSPEAMKRRFIDYYVHHNAGPDDEAGNSGGVLEMPFNMGRNTSYLVIPKALLKTAEDFQKLHPRLVKLHTAQSLRGLPEDAGGMKHNEL